MIELRNKHYSVNS